MLYSKTHKMNKPFPNVLQGSHGDLYKSKSARAIILINVLRVQLWTCLQHTPAVSSHIGHGVITGLVLIPLWKMFNFRKTVLLRFIEVAGFAGFCYFLYFYDVQEYSQNISDIISDIDVSNKWKMAHNGKKKRYPKKRIFIPINSTASSTTLLPIARDKWILPMTRVTTRKYSRTCDCYTVGWPHFRRIVTRESFLCILRGQQEHHSTTWWRKLAIWEKLKWKNISAGPFLIGL